MAEEEIVNNEQSYSAKNIQVLEGLEAVRKRPAMYIGDTDEKDASPGIRSCRQLYRRSPGRLLFRHQVWINEDGSITVSDNGRGIPVDMHEKEGRSALEVVLTVLHAGGKFDKGSYKVSGGLHGVGVSCVNALSDRLFVQIFRNGKVYEQEYHRANSLSGQRNGNYRSNRNYHHSNPTVRYSPRWNINTTYWPTVCVNSLT